MKTFRMVVSVIIMVLAGFVGFFVGASVNDSMGGAIVFSMIAGIVCVIYTLDSREEQSVFAELQTGHGCLPVSRALLFSLPPIHIEWRCCAWLHGKEFLLSAWLSLQ